jgi:putative aldouronate transport system substrate-binding protein
MKKRTWMQKSSSSIAAALALGLVAAACGTAPADNGSTEEETPATGAETPAAPAAEEPAKRGSITSSLYDRGTVPAEEGTMDNNRWTKWVNENGPSDVKYVTVPRFESLQKFNVMFASGSAPDLILEFDTAYQGQLYTQKQLLPLDDLIAEHSTEYKAMLEKYPAIKKAATMEDGKMYMLGRPLEFGPQHFLFIRADWLKKLNLETPKTPEELLAVAEAFATQDPDGNGQADTEGIGLSFVAGIILNHMFGSGFTLFGTDQNPWMLDESGKVVHDWDRMKAAFEFQKQIYDAGVADRDFVTDKNGEKQKQQWIAGKLGIYGGNGSDVKIYEALKTNVPDADIVPIPLPVTPFGQFSPILSAPVQLTGMINAAAKDPVAVMKHVDFMASEAYRDTIANGLEGVHHTKAANGCPQAIDAEKNKKELGYAGDMNMLAPLVGDCFGLENKVNPTEAEKGMIALRAMAREAYMDPAKPMVGLTHGSFMPILPQDLLQIKTNANKTIVDLAVKAIVSGGSYTVDQFIEEAKSVWDKAGGAKVDQFYSDWYEKNKDSALLMDDIYELAP